MQRVNRRDGRRVALVATLCVCVCVFIFESRPQASSRTAAGAVRSHVASAWEGERVAMAAPPPADDIALPKGTWVLHVGDSFVEAFLWQNLKPRFEEIGAKYVVHAETATYTTTWAFDLELEGWLARRPALVLVTLGANEVDIPAPERHGRAVALLARKIAAAGASCAWITPPLWKPETGILQVIHDNCAPCLFVDSDALTGGLVPQERQRDRIHPNPRGGGRWSSAVWAWLVDHRDPSRGPWGLAPFERR